ncbi:MAG: MgtC/SapB family protein [Phycisphaerales bacterium]|nr:MgtC/SapB family protein [Phycisphaerales bacterium]
MDFLHSFFVSGMSVAQIDWSVPYDEKVSVMLRLGLAALFGALLGWERGRAEKPADIRTMILIGAGAAMFTLLGERMIESGGDEAIIRADPTRVLSYIISGVGFLGAGAILHSKRSVKGLTTAASIWAVAAIGAACGFGEFMIALFLFSIAFVTLWTPWVVALADGTLDEYEITPIDANKVDEEPSKKVGEKDKAEG